MQININANARIISMGITLNDDHLRIIQVLRREPRKSFLEISRITNIPLEKVFELYDEMKRSNILRTITFVDLHSNNVLNVFLIFTPMINQHKILEYLKHNTNVNSISLTEREFIVHSSFIDLSEYDSFIDALEGLGVVEVDDYFIKEVVV